MLFQGTTSANVTATSNADWNVATNGNNVEATYTGAGINAAARDANVNNAGTLTITVTSCREQLPDPEVYADCIQASFDELSEAARQQVERGIIGRQITDKTPWSKLHSTSWFNVPVKANSVAGASV